jgi:hypothetical protein
MQSYSSSPMATFHANEKPNLIIMVDDFNFTQATKGCLSTMLGFQERSIHISKDLLYEESN